MRKKGQIYQYLLLIITLPMILHCAVPKWNTYKKDGHVYGVIEGNWRGQWWDYYLRGLSYSQGEYWEEAISDFQNAYQLRLKDQRRVRTHGLHMLDEYFPHREAGIVYYKTKRYQEAISELKLSIRHFGSAKAKYFLNLAREAYLGQSRADIYPPQIYISSPKDMYTNQFEIEIEGYVTDDQFAKEISINGEILPVELALPKLEYKKKIGLKKGKNLFLIKATDLVGHSSDKTFEIISDRDAPMIYIDEIEPLNKGQGYIIKGYVDDDIGVEQLKLNGQNVALENSDRGFFSADVFIYSNKKVDFYIEDKLKNSTSGEIELESESTCENKLAYLGSNLSQIIVQRRNVGGEDLAAPSIKFKNLPKALRVNWDEIYIEGEVRDEDKVVSLSINNVPILTRSSSRLFFNHHIRLNEGVNIITVSAEDNNGNISTEQIEVYREIKSIYKVGSRLSLALIPFKYSGHREELKNLIYDQLIQVFIQQKRFQFVDREKINSLLSRSESEEYSSMELGRLVSAEGVIVGSAYFYNDYLEVIARLIDTETSVVLDSEDVFGEVENLSDVMLLLNGLALKFKQALPLTEGVVTAMGGSGNIQLDLKANDGIKKHMKVIFYKFKKEGLMNVPIIIGEGRLTEVYEEFSRGILTEQIHDMLSIKPEDKIITK